MKDVPFLIVGGGPVGLTASILLSQQGVRSLLVERHPGTAVHPKARGINARTMEMYRQLGVETAIRKAGLPPERAGFIVWAETLAGREIERRVPWRSGPQSAMVSPVRNCLCAQDDLEPVLRAFAEQQPTATLAFNTELESFDQDGDSVTATLGDRASGAASEVRARYVIAADGAQSRVRRQLGVRMVGRDNVYDSVNVLMNADLRPWTQHRPAALYFIENPRLRATFLTINGIDRWGFLVNSLAAYGYKAGDFTPERSTALIRDAAGVPDLDVKVLGVAPWTASAHVAEQYRHGRVFLAGDAAHEMPPTGGFGMNTGVQDVHKLAWKLAAVLRRGRRALPARHLPCRAPTARRGDHRAKSRQRDLDGKAQPHQRDRRRPAGVSQRAGHDLRRRLCVERHRPRWQPSRQGRQSRHGLCALGATGRTRTACVAAAGWRASVDHRPDRPGFHLVHDGKGHGLGRCGATARHRRP